MLIPAIDVLEGEAVRLLQGDFARVALRAGDPFRLVRRFAAHCPDLLHVVDLSGARDGGVRPEVVARVVDAAAGVPVQVAGGVRAPRDAAALVAAGASRVVIGTAAFTTDLAAYVETLGERLVVALDVVDGSIATDGWTRTRSALEDAVPRCARAGVPRLLCTSIARDGTLTGPDLELLARVRAQWQGPLLAAGGVRSLADLAALGAVGVEGAVVGRALLDGSIPLTAIGRRPLRPRRAASRTSSGTGRPAATLRRRGR